MPGVYWNRHKCITVCFGLQAQVFVEAGSKHYLQTLHAVRGRLRQWQNFGQSAARARSNVGWIFGDPNGRLLGNPDGMLSTALKKGRNIPFGKKSAVLR